jgi:GNAT superfamily N-acetyltransferase
VSQSFFRSYRETDRQACAKVFDANCPEYFAPNERDDYDSFLEAVPEDYEVCEVDGQLVGAFGLLDDGVDEKQLNWILLDPQAQGVGIGKKIMERVIHLGRDASARQVNIAASQKSAPFFARFGATPAKTVIEGWGPGLDRVDMVLLL